MSLKVTGLYGAYLSFLFFVLSWAVIRGRRKGNTSFGDGGDETLLTRIRAHANFAEYVPFIIVLLGIAEAGGLNGLAVHAIGALLCLSRTMHAYAVMGGGPMIARIYGTIWTYACLLACGTVLLLQSVL